VLIKSLFESDFIQTFTDGQASCQKHLRTVCLCLKIFDSTFGLACEMRCMPQAAQVLRHFMRYGTLGHFALHITMLHL
jgi:hypothetical protein